MFFERGLRLLRGGGRCALIVPSGFATDQQCGPLRRRLLERTVVDTFTTVDNHDGIFPIHRSLKFLLLTFTAGGATAAVPMRSGVRSCETLDRVPDAGIDRDAVLLQKTLIERISGEGLELPDLRCEEDVRIVSGITFRVPASSDPAGWNIHFGRELNATDDKPHFTAGPGLPIVEGKHLRPFGVDACPVRFRIPQRAAAVLLDPARTFGRDRLAYRDVASPTNRTTLIAAIVPRNVVTTHTVFCVKEGLEPEEQHFLCGILNSYVANYLVRMRVGTHVTTAIVARLPIPKPERSHPLFTGIASVARSLAAQWNPADDRRLNAMAGYLYGLDQAGFARVVSTFPLIDAAERSAAVAEFERIASKASGNAG